jgi:hypothetical protein
MITTTVTMPTAFGRDAGERETETDYRANDRQEDARDAVNRGEREAMLPRNHPDGNPSGDGKFQARIRARME